MPGTTTAREDGHLKVAATTERKLGAEYEKARTCNENQWEAVELVSDGKGWEGAALYACRRVTYTGCLALSTK